MYDFKVKHILRTRAVYSLTHRRNEQLGMFSANIIEEKITNAVV